MPIRQTTELVARVICFAGFFDSAAAMVTISVPMKLNTVVSSAPSTALKPLGMKPPCSWVSRIRPLTSWPGRPPVRANTPRTMKPITAMTLSRANQNSNSP
ncbi:hypothetical protein D9M69_317180 [compost metagenome]